MASKSSVSPSVTIREFDFSFIPSGVSQIGAALIGTAPKGPAFVPTTVNSFDEFRSIFGDLSEFHYLTYAVKEYLKNAGVITITRVLGENASSAIGTPAYVQFPQTGTSGASSATNSVLAVLRTRNSNVTNVQLSGYPSSFTITTTSGATIESASNLSLDMASNRYIKNVLGTSPLTAAAGDLLPGVYVESVFDFNYANVSGTATQGAITSSSASTVAGNYQNARSPHVVSQNLNGTVYPLFTVYSRTDGNASTDRVKITINSVDIDTTTELEYPKFSVQVRDFYDTDQNQVVYESYQVNLDPTSPTYIAKQIGDISITVDNTGDIPILMEDGDFKTISKYIYVKMESGYPVTARPSGFKKYPGSGLGVIPSMPYKYDHSNEVTSTRDQRVNMGVDFYLQETSIANRAAYGTSLVTANSNTANKGFLILALSGELTNTAPLSSTYEFVNVTSSGTSVTASQSYVNTVQFTFPLYGGWDSLDPRTDIRYFQNNGVLYDEYIKAINILSNDDQYDFNLLALPGVHSAASGNVIGSAISMCENRGDAMVIFDLGVDNTDLNTGVNLTVAQATAQADRFDSNYAACYYPWIKIPDPDVSGKEIWFPPSVAVLGAYSFNDRTAAPYYAVGGLTRGLLSSVTKIRKILTADMRNTLYLKNVNPIVNIKGEGIQILGNKTLQKKQSALDRVNVRRLILVMKKIIASTSRLFLFEPNTQKTRDKILNLLNPEFNRIKNDNGLDDFRLVLDDTINTPDVIDRNQLYGKVFIKPTKAIEFIIFDVNINDSGATFSE